MPGTQSGAHALSLLIVLSLLTSTVQSLLLKYAPESALCSAADGRLVAAGTEGKHGLRQLPWKSALVTY